MESMYVLRQVDNLLYIVTEFKAEEFDAAVTAGEWQRLLYIADIVLDADTRMVLQARQF